MHSSTEEQYESNYTQIGQKTGLKVYAKNVIFSLPIQLNILVFSYCFNCCHAQTVKHAYYIVLI